MRRASPEGGSGTDTDANAARADSVCCFRCTSSMALELLDPELRQQAPVADQHHPSNPKCARSFSIWSVTVWGSAVWPGYASTTTGHPPGAVGTA